MMATTTICYYPQCNLPVETTVHDSSWIYVIDHSADHLIKFAHTECAECFDDLIIESVDF